jgi:hypothetical protein
MTKLTKPVRRTVDDVAREDIVLTLYPSKMIGLRRKRCRTEYTLPLATVYRLAIQAALAQKKAERAKTRGRRRLVSRGLLTGGQ